MLLLLCCAVLRPGYYAAAMTGPVITAAVLCPQKYYCAGGAPLGPFDPANPAGRNVQDLTVRPCPNGQWTQAPGASSLSQCCKQPGVTAQLNSNNSYSRLYKAGGLGQQRQGPANTEVCLAKELLLALREEQFDVLCLYSSGLGDLLSGVGDLLLSLLSAVLVDNLP